ncbi:hypothetical protein [Lactococcus fujiensis]|uniref:Uncharacterized protein n=1 Tax=Lactococcus fujiensis JCM 16395 TaxID=1291764 RepID=A0A2A5RK63_9LACT|nr:hypothetical protein [Lactococcus fujiensis]PCR99543.1 hypothetical protein RT41_GL001919 [Lactococcus fujiensis JCM 16395]
MRNTFDHFQTVIQWWRYNGDIISVTNSVEILLHGIIEGLLLKIPFLS